MKGEEQSFETVVLAVIVGIVVLVVILTFVNEYADRIKSGSIEGNLEYTEYDEKNPYVPTTGDLTISENYIGWPAESKKITSCYGPRTLAGKTDYHKGIDISVPLGSPVFAVYDGKIYEVKEGCRSHDKNCPALTGDSDCKCNNGLGNYMIVEHEDNNGKKFYVYYVHLNKALKKKGESVKSGDKIGESGNSGYSEGPHLHFAIYKDPALSHYKYPEYTYNPCEYIDCSQSTGKSCQQG
jgi:murein DD-endopeptidase MepM/ murein hydrolase activator NlpD